MVETTPSIQLYKDTAKRILGTNFPGLTLMDIDSALDYSINKRYKTEPCTIDNSYSKKKVNMNLQSLTDYIISRSPIITPYGVLWKQKSSSQNPLCDMTKKFMDQRGVYKSEMFRFPKGSEDFEKYNLLQLLS